jgi:hypothetical protein
MNFEFTLADEAEFVTAVVQVPHGIEGLGSVLADARLESPRELPGTGDDQESLGPSNQGYRTLEATPAVVDWATPEAEAGHKISLKSPFLTTWMHIMMEFLSSTEMLLISLDQDQP